MTLLLKIRLRWFFFILLAAFFGLAYAVPVTEQFNPSLATLLVIAALMYGFFITPILTAQKRRIEALSKIIRAEASAMFDILLKTKKTARAKPQPDPGHVRRLPGRQLPPAQTGRRRTRIRTPHLVLHGLQRQRSGNDRKILDKLVANQANRSQLAMQLNNRVLPTNGGSWQYCLPLRWALSCRSTCPAWSATLSKHCSAPALAC